MYYQRGRVIIPTGPANCAYRYLAFFSPPSLPIPLYRVPRALRGTKGNSRRNEPVRELSRARVYQITFNEKIELMREEGREREPARVVEAPGALRSDDVKDRRSCGAVDAGDGETGAC